VGFGGFHSGGFHRGFGGRSIALGLGHYCGGYGYPTIGHA